MEKLQQAIEKARIQREAQREAARNGGVATSEAAPARPNGEADSFDLAPAAARLVPRRARTVDRQRIVAAAAPGLASDAFRVLRTQLLARLEERGNSLAVTSADQGDGKTLVAVNLAISAARHLHRRALLVDLDFRRPGLARSFEFRPEASLSDYLEGRVALADCLVDPGIDRLVLLPQGHSVEHSSELLASPRMAALAHELARRHPEQLVIYDCPPLLGTDDALIALGYAAGCLLVVREGKTTRAELLRAAELVGEARLLGTVLNCAVWSRTAGYESYAYYGG
jgi:protein-tyrosine kinase